MKKLAHKRRGMTLAELMVSIALLAVVSLVTLELYLAAQTEFEHSSGTMTLNQRARTTIDRICQVAKTATPLLNNQTEAFVHPNSVNDMNRELYELDFISTINYLRNPTLGTTWPVTDTLSAAYVGPPQAPRLIYETDLSTTSIVARQPPYYRFRIAWNNTLTNLTGTRANVTGRSVYLERLTFGTGGAGALNWGEGPNLGPSSYKSQWLPDTGTPYTGADMKPKILGRNVHYLTFDRITGNVILMRMKMYNRDPLDATGRPIEGITMRRPGHGGNRDANGNQRLFLIDLTTNIQLPNAI